MVLLLMGMELTSLVGDGARVAAITETNRTHFALFGMQNRAFKPYLMTDTRMLISVMCVSQFFYIRTKSRLLCAAFIRWVL
jgi:hypothetical protein